MAYKGRVKKSVQKRSRRTKRRSTKRVVPGVSLSVKRYVNRTIHSNIENKKMTTEFTKNLMNISSGTAGFQTQNIIPLCPNAATGGIYTITQGVGQQQRIANVISVRKAYFRGLLVPTAYNSISNSSPAPLNVKMWIFSMKRNVIQQTQSDAYQVLNTIFFANGNSSLGLLGNAYDLITPPNRDVVNVHYSRTLKLGYASYAGMTGGSSATDPKTDNDYKLNHKFTIDITKYLPKKMFFNDTDSGTTSKQVFLAFEPVYYNGASMTPATSPCGLFGGIDLHYEDA